MPHPLKCMKATTVDIKTTSDFLIAAGRVPGTSHINKFGRNPEIDSATAPEDIWDAGGLWVPPTTYRLHNIASTSDNDTGTLVTSGTATGGSTTSIIDDSATFITDGVAVGDAVLNDTNIDHSMVKTVVSETELELESSHHAAFTEQQADSIGFNNNDSYRIATPASTGASVVHIYGLDENFDEKEEFIILDGNPAGAGSNVPTVNTYWRIYRMHLDGAASRVTNNVGTITATAQTDNTVQSTISIGLGQSLQAIYTIPRGKTGYMTHFSSTIFKGAVGALANMTLRQTKFAGPDGAGSVTEHYFSLATDGSSHITHNFRPYKVFEEKTDVWMRCEATSTNTVQITGAFDIILVDNI